MLLSLISLFGANFCFVFFKAFQQRNVTNDNYWPVIPTSFAMALTEIYVIATISIKAISDELTLMHLVAIALGGGLGCLTSMYLHKKVFKNNGSVPTVHT
jgi:hypothetical protein